MFDRPEGTQPMSDTLARIVPFPRQPAPRMSPEDAAHAATVAIAIASLERESAERGTDVTQVVAWLRSTVPAS